MPTPSKHQLPYACRVKLRTEDGFHFKAADGKCPNCGWPFPKSQTVISGEIPISGKMIQPKKLDKPDGVE